MMIERTHVHHETIVDNSDVGVRVFISEEQAGFKQSHWHRHLEIVLVLEGEVTFRFENQEVILHANEFVIISSDLIHSATNRQNKSLVLQIPVHYLNQYWPHSDLLRFPLSYVDVKQQATYQEIAKCLAEMAKIYAIKNTGYLLKFTEHMMQVLYLLITTYAVMVSIDKQVENDRLKNVLRHIHEHYADALTIRDLAQEFHYHPDYLSRYFKQEVGIPFTKYLYQLRLAYVYQELVHSKKSVKDCFAVHGITNTKLGMRNFKLIYGDTPLHIRKKFGES